MIETYLFYFLIFALGTVFGSFFNLVSDRVVLGEPIFFGRSHCDFCKTKLTVKNLIPLLSYLIQKGKSVCCKKKLSWSYPVSEFFTGAAFLFAANFTRIFTDFSTIKFLGFIYLVAVLSFFIILFLTDAKYGLLPDKIVFPAIIFVSVSIIVLSILDLKFYHDKLLSDSVGKYLIQVGFWNQQLWAVARRMLVLVASSFFISLFFVALITLTKGRGMGGGDVKLGFLIGLFNGFPGNILAIFLGFFTGALYSLVLMSLKKKGMKDTIAFGPFLIIGSILSLVWGENLINWYLGLF